MQITLIDVDHTQEKAFIEFTGETVTANVSFGLSELDTLEDLISSVRTIIKEARTDRFIQRLEKWRLRSREKNKSDIAKTVAPSSNKSTRKGASTVGKERADKKDSTGLLSRA